MNKISKDYLESQIKEIKYTRLSDRMLHCLIITKTGFEFTGEASVVDPKNFNEDIGKEISYNNAFDKMWLPYGFLLHNDINNSQGIKKTKQWFEAVKPEPVLESFVVQYSVLLEEVAESLEALGLPHLELLTTLQDLREGNYTQYLKDTFYDLEDKNKRIEFLDAMCDIIVTAVGSSHMLKQDIVNALDNVNDSNWSKFDENGNPIFNDFGKVIKGSNYKKPELESFV